MKNLFFFLLVANLVFFLGARLFMPEPPPALDLRGGGNIRFLSGEELAAYRANNAEPVGADNPVPEIPATDSQDDLTGVEAPSTAAQSPAGELKELSSIEPPGADEVAALPTDVEMPPQVEQLPESASVLQKPALTKPDAPPIPPESVEKPGLAAAAEEPKAQMRCLMVGPVASREDADKLAADFAGSNMAGTVRRELRQEVRSYLVMIPATSADHAASLVRKLRAAGHSDVWWLTSGDHKDDVSVGIFRERRNANARQKEMQKQGFNAEVVPRQIERENYWIDLREAASRAVTAKLMAQLRKEYPAIGAEPARCPHSPL